MNCFKKQTSYYLFQYGLFKSVWFYPLFHFLFPLIPSNYKMIFTNFAQAFAMHITSFLSTLIYFWNNLWYLSFLILQLILISWLFVSISHSLFTIFFKCFPCLLINVKCCYVAFFETNNELIVSWPVECRKTVSLRRIYIFQSVVLDIMHERNVFRIILRSIWFLQLCIIWFQNSC